MTILKCDYDGRLPVDLAARVQMMARMQRLAVEYVRYHRTRRGWHVTVAVRQRIALARVVCLQAILGSDWKRELFNSCRTLAIRRTSPFWRERANVLYVRHYRRIPA